MRNNTEKIVVISFQIHFEAMHSKTGNCKLLGYVFQISCAVNIWHNYFFMLQFFVKMREMSTQTAVQHAHNLWFNNPNRLFLMLDNEYNTK